MSNIDISKVTSVSFNYIFKNLQSYIKKKITIIYRIYYIFLRQYQQTPSELVRRLDKRYGTVQKEREDKVESTVNESDPSNSSERNRPGASCRVKRARLVACRPDR